LAGLTAWQALITKGKLKKVDNVLIHAGSGGVGRGRHFGDSNRQAFWCAYCDDVSSAQRGFGSRSRGADGVIDYKSQAFEDELSDYDLVFDIVDGETRNRFYKVLKKVGTLVSIKGQDDDNLAPEYGIRFEWFFM
jgi:NADPH:quinone reductase-like Zn-dependent oxidoreductase